MITRDVVAAQLLAYLNEAQTLAQLVDWAESVFIDGWFAPEADQTMLRDIVAYLAAADTAAFPLTWDVCLDFMKQVGQPVRVVAAPQAI